MGNVGSILNMLRHVRVGASLVRRPEELRQASHLVLPGVGSFDCGMERLRERDLVEVLRDRVMEKGVPVLGICLGMQLMTRRSEEGRLDGLGWVDAETRKLRAADGHERLRLPHMGWNEVTAAKRADVFEAFGGEIRFYFVHSYHVACGNWDDVLATTFYGREFVSAFQVNNLWGVQFHPEKSHRFGMGFLRRFAEAV